MRSNRRSPFSIPALLSLALALVALPLAAQEPQMEMDEEMMAMMEAFQKAGTPGEPHEAMAKSTGSWKFTMSSWMDPSAPPMKSGGTAERSMVLGGRVLQEKVVGDMMGQTFHGVGHRGYDNVKGEYWATWMDSMSTGIFMATGKADDSGAVVMHGEMVDPMSGSTVKIRSMQHFEEDGSEHFEWFEDRGEGEVKTMEIVYERAG